MLRPETENTSICMPLTCEIWGLEEFRPTLLPPPFELETVYTDKILLLPLNQYMPGEVRDLLVQEDVNTINSKKERQLSTDCRTFRHPTGQATRDSLFRRCFRTLSAFVELS